MTRQGSSKKEYDLNFFLDYMVSEGRVPLKDIEDEELKKAFNPYIVSKFLSLNFKTWKGAFKVNRYVFSLHGHKEILFALMYALTPKVGKFGRVKYVSAKKKKESRYPQEVIDAVRKYLDYEHLTVEEIEDVIDLNLKLEPEKFLEFLLKSGFDLKFIQTNFEKLKPYLKGKNVSKLTKKEKKEILSLLKKEEQQEHYRVDEFL